MINVAVFGYGTVGSGVVDVIMDNNAVVSKHVGDDITVKYILDIREFKGDKYESKLVTDVDVIVNDPEVDIVCETMGGTKFAYPFTKKALEAGKSVCTSNKELVELYGPELIEIAKAHNCSYKFEASVGGGIPIIRPLQDCITADVIESVAGIVNGTTNFMLTNMDKEDDEFDEVLKRAQDLGYAEKDPTADVEGHDACRKIAILSSLVYGKSVHASDIPTEGITKISARDFKYAKQMNKGIKLLARFENNNGEPYAMVAPFLLDKEDPLYFVNYVNNAIKVTGNMLGEAMFYGQGAGKLATASAVVGDVIECGKNLGKHLPCDWKNETVTLTGFENAKRCFFVRTGAEVTKEAKELFDISEEIKIGFFDEFAFVTKEMSEKDFAVAKEKLGMGVINYLRIEA